MPDEIAQAPAKDNPGPQSAQGTSTVGTPAPSLASVRWIQGDAADAGSPRGPFAIEFWSQWSGEHLAELGELGKSFPDIRFSSVAVGGLDEPSVRAVLGETSETAGLHVGFDASASSGAAGTEAVVRDWLQAFGEKGLPITFLVDGNGQVRWIGPARRLRRVLTEFRAGKLVADPAGHQRRQMLQSLEMDPAANVDEKAFEPVFGRRPPEFGTGTIAWLSAPASKPAEPARTEAASAAKPGGFLGRVFGRAKNEPAPEPARTVATPVAKTDRFGPPRPGRAVGLILADVITERSLEPGWNVLNEPDLNDLPAEFPEVDFVVLVRTHEPLASLFEADYADELARWTGEIGWRLGSEVTVDATSNTESPDAEGVIDFFADETNLIALPAGVLIDPAGQIVWAGSPLLLPDALKAWRAGELTPRKAAADLIYWYRLLASNSANERLAGIAGARSGGMPNWQGFPAETFESERWAEIIDQLKGQLPWRAHLWSVFEFSLATREARKPGGAVNAAQAIVDRFEELTGRFEDEFRSMDSQRLTDYDYDPLDPWRMTILTAVDYLGILREGVEPLEGADLFAIEAHPLTQAVVDSAKRLDDCLRSIPAESLYLPSVWPVLMLRLGHRAEAKRGFEAEETRFERFLEALRAATADADSVAASIGADPEEYRSVIRNFKAMCG